MKRKRLTKKDHAALAAHLSSISNHVGMMHDIMTGKVPEAIEWQVAPCAQVFKWKLALARALHDLLESDFSDANGLPRSPYFWNPGVDELYAEIDAHYRAHAATTASSDEA